MASQTNTTSPKVGFFDLPPELRQIVYFYSYGFQSTWVLKCHQSLDYGSDSPYLSSKSICGFYKEETSAQHGGTQDQEAKAKEHLPRSDDEDGEILEKPSQMFLLLSSPLLQVSKVTREEVRNALPWFKDSLEKECKRMGVKEAAKRLFLLGGQKRLECMPRCCSTIFQITRFLWPLPLNARNTIDAITMSMTLRGDSNTRSSWDSAYPSSSLEGVKPSYATQFMVWMLPNLRKVTLQIDDMEYPSYDTRCYPNMLALLQLGRLDVVRLVLVQEAVQGFQDASTWQLVKDTEELLSIRPFCKVDESWLNLITNPAASLAMDIEATVEHLRSEHGPFYSIRKIKHQITMKRKLYIHGQDTDNESRQFEVHVRPSNFDDCGWCTSIARTMKQGAISSALSSSSDEWISTNE